MRISLMTPMDKHKALIEAAMIAISNAERSGIGLGPLDSVDQMLLDDADYIRPQAIAALNAVYAEHKPLIDMIKGVVDEGYYPDNPIWDEVRVALSALSSPLGKGE